MGQKKCRKRKREFQGNKYATVKKKINIDEYVVKDDVFI